MMFTVKLKKGWIRNWKLASRSTNPKYFDSWCFFSFSILESFFRKPLVDKTGVVDGFTRVTEAPECQKYWWGQAPLPPLQGPDRNRINLSAQNWVPMSPKPSRRLCLVRCGGWWGEWRNSSYVIVVLTVSNCCCKEFCKLQLRIVRS